MHMAGWRTAEGKIAARRQTAIIGLHCEVLASLLASSASRVPRHQARLLLCDDIEAAIFLFVRIVCAFLLLADCLFLVWRCVYVECLALIDSVDCLSFCRGCKYEVAQFSDGTLDIVPRSWKLNKDQVMYPHSFKDEEARKNKLKSCLPPKPKSEFKKYRCKVVLASGKSCSSVFALVSRSCKTW